MADLGKDSKADPANLESARSAEPEITNIEMAAAGTKSGTSGHDANSNNKDAIEAAPNVSSSSSSINAGRDRAAQFLKQADHQVVVTPEENARVLRLIDLRLLPLLLVVYCLQSLDKTTLSYASVFGIIDDAGLVGDQFSWLGSVVYIAQLVFQPLVAYSLVRFPIGKFSATMVLCWGAVLCGMTASHNFSGLLVSRLLLGAFEASVGACFVPLSFYFSSLLLSLLKVLVPGLT
jgi:hypothetical protein